MNKNKIVSLIILCLVLMTVLFNYTYINQETEVNLPKALDSQVVATTSSPQEGEVTNSTSSYNYTNEKLGISFSSDRTLFERNIREENGGGYMTQTETFISQDEDPHFYETKECALSDSYRLTCDIGFEIQKHEPSPGYTVAQTVDSFKGNVVTVNNAYFDVYKKEETGPGWSLWYTVVPKKSNNVYFLVATDPRTALFLENKILPAFKLR